MTSARTTTEEFPLSQLPELIHTAWDDHRSKVKKTVVRIASFNLLVVSSGETDPELAALVEGLQVSHPCRMIWTKLKPEKDWGESTAALNLVTRCDGQQVCSEQIILRCGNERARIPSIVLPLIQSGLPTHLLWWKAGPLDGPLFTRLQDRARLVLWEPETLPSSWAVQYLERMWSDPYQFEHAVYPMDWFRILGRRKQIANAYDHGRVQVKAFDTGAQMSLPHRLLEAWLRSRLAKAPGGVEFNWTSGKSGCQILGASSSEWIDSPLIDDVSATRMALDDDAERDAVFAQTLKTMLAPAAP